MQITAADREAIIDLVEQFKPPHLSTVDALINLAASHAATIRQQAEKIRTMEQVIQGVRDTLKFLTEEGKT